MTDEQYDEILAFVRAHAIPGLLDVDLLVADVDEPQLLRTPARIVLSHADYADLQRRADAGPPPLHSLS